MPARAQDGMGHANRSHGVLHMGRDSLRSTVRLTAACLALASLGCVGTIYEAGGSPIEAEEPRPDTPSTAAPGNTVAPSTPPGEVPDPLTGAPFWRSVSFDRAIDFGHAPEPIAAAERQEAGEVMLREVTVEAGLAEAAGGGNTHGVGVAFLDLDGDDYPDIFVANGRNERSGMQYRSALYHNDGDGAFSDVTDQSRVGAILADRDTYSVAAGDYDADGDIDLYVGAQPRDVLLQNQGDGTFVDATGGAGAGGPASDPSAVSDGKSKITSFGDFDGDGWLDLVSASSTLPEPGVYLLRNRGDGTFEDVTGATGVRTHRSGNPCAVMWSDYDTDGDVDLWIWNDRGGHILLRNDGAVFEEATADGVDISNPMGIDAADIDHDLDLDYYVSNIGPAPLLQNEGDGTFTNITDFSGTRGDYTWGLGFADFNLDTWPDIFVAQEDNRDHLLYTNRGQSPPWFEETAVSHPEVMSGGDAHNVAVAFADFDRDGRVDVVLAGTDGRPLMLYRNETDVGTNRWLDVQVRAAPSGARGGINARVAIRSGDLIQFRDITGGSSRASQNELSVRFGIGHWTGVEWVVVLWPNGDHAAATHVAGNQTVTMHAP